MYNDQQVFSLSWYFISRSPQEKFIPTLDALALTCEAANFHK